MPNTQTHRCSYFYSLLIAMTMGGVGGGCGQAEPLSETSSTLNICGDEVGSRIHTAGAYGSTPGGLEGYDCSVGVNTAVAAITGYADSDRIYGIELKWGTHDSKLYGVTNALVPQSLNFADDPINEIRVCVDSDNLLSGIHFKTLSGVALSLGRLCGSSNQIAFNNVYDVLTNMKTWRGTYLLGVKFVYASPL